MSEPVNGADERELCKVAKKILARLCEEGHVRMSIPVRADDEDIVLCDVIALAERAIPDAAQVSAREYYYRVDECRAIDASDPNCVCWHKAGAGPFPALVEGGRREEFDPYTWRDGKTGAEQMPILSDDQIAETARRAFDHYWVEDHTCSEAGAWAASGRAVLALSQQRDAK